MIIPNNYIHFQDCNAILANMMECTNTLNFRMFAPVIQSCVVHDVVDLKDGETVDIGTPDAGIYYIITIGFYIVVGGKSEQWCDILILTDGDVWWQISWITPGTYKFIHHKYILGREFKATTVAAIEVYNARLH